MLDKRKLNNIVWAPGDQKNCFYYFIILFLKNLIFLNKKQLKYKILTI